MLWVRVECLSHCSQSQPITLGAHSLASATCSHSQTLRFEVWSPVWAGVGGDSMGALLFSGSRQVRPDQS